MIIYIDNDDNTIKGFKNPVFSLDLSEIDKIKKHLSGATLLYVNEVIETTSKEIIDLISDFSPEENSSSIDYNSKDLYLCIPNGKSGYIHIGSLKLEFDDTNGIKDFKPFAQWKDNKTIMDLVSKGLLIVVDEKNKGIVERQFNNKNETKEKMNLTNSDGTPMIINSHKESQVLQMDERFEDITDENSQEFTTFEHLRLKDELDVKTKISNKNTPKRKAK